jgi:hypothetical protein
MATTLEIVSSTYGIGLLSDSRSCYRSGVARPPGFTGCAGEGGRVQGGQEWKRLSARKYNSGCIKGNITPICLCPSSGQ